jgi:hypothetical protein
VADADCRGDSEDCLSSWFELKLLVVTPSGFSFSRSFPFRRGILVVEGGWVPFLFASLLDLFSCTDYVPTDRVSCHCNGSTKILSLTSRTRGAGQVLSFVALNSCLALKIHKCHLSRLIDTRLLGHE